MASGWTRSPWAEHICHGRRKEPPRTIFWYARDMNTKFSFCLLLLVAACSGGGKPADGPTDGSAPTGTATATANATSTATAPNATEGNPPAADCGGKTCGAGESCVSYYGVAGPRGPQFHDCVIPCKRGSANDGCPEGKRCTTIADGPGDVCQ